MKRISPLLTIEQRIPLWRLRSATNENGCWLWTGSRSDGYGNVGVGGKVYKLHILAYKHFIGPIPDGLELDHKCRIRHCWNPQHVEPVTHKVNMERGERAMKTHCRHGHPYDEKNTQLFQGRRYCRTCMNLDKNRRDRERREAR